MPGRVVWRDRGAEGCRVVVTHILEQRLAFLWPRTLPSDPSRPPTAAIANGGYFGA